MGLIVWHVSNFKLHLRYFGASKCWVYNLEQILIVAFYLGGKKSSNSYASTLLTTSRGPVVEVWGKYRAHT